MTRSPKSTTWSDYAATSPKGWCGDPTRGAALGRQDIKDLPKDSNAKLRLIRVYLNSGGYDTNGVYFGEGAPLYWCHYRDPASGKMVVDFMLRAGSREDAKKVVLKHYPNASFYRVPGAK